MENIPTPPEFKKTFQELNSQSNFDFYFKVCLIHEIRVLNFYMAEIETSLRSIANEQ